MIKRQLVKYFRLTKDFGAYIALNEFFLRVVGRIIGRNKFFWKKLSEYKYSYINKKFVIEFHDLIKKYSNKQRHNKISDVSIIWIFWAQGIDKAPSIVKLCVESIKKNSGKHPVVIVDDKTLSNYIQVDKNVLRKYKEGIISNPHFSDIVRFKLLAEYGGIWCDATVFLSKSIDALSLNKYEFFTVRHNIGRDYLACKGLWSTFFVASSKDNILSSFVYECLCKYWNQHESAIDYLFLDSIISIGYEYVMPITKMINSVPVNNVNVFNAIHLFENLEEKNKIEKALDSNSVNKLTYKTIRGKNQTELMEKVLSEYNKR